jgi:molybdopterin converting factor subunit 1
MRVRVRFFAGTRDAVGAAQRVLDLDAGATTGDLFARLAADHPLLARYRQHALIARNGEMVGDRAPLAEGDEVAVMPPVSGGALDEAPFSLDGLVEGLRKEGAGAVVTFTGLVRPTSGEQPGARVERLEFEAYEPMAERTLEEVREEAVAKFGLVDARIRHRVGALALKEPIVAVVVSARHRREAFEAAAWIMDELKTRVPIWKREVDADGARRWVNDPTQEAIE